MASNPTSLGTPVLGSTEAALVFSVTSAPTSGALIVAVAHMFTNGETALSSLSISDTLGGLSWTKVGGEAYLGSGNECDTVIFYATAPASPTTGTITVTPSRTGAAGTGMYLSASQVTGQGSTPVGATGTSINSATVPLGAPPAASSLVFVANTLGLGSDPAQGQPTGVTALYTDQHAGSFAYATAGYKNGSAGTSYTYPVNSNSSCAAIEILAATVPGAPTAATATAGAASATVTFTAPASNGGSPITGYTATSTPGGITGTVSGPTAAPITVSGLTPGTAYTFTVHATNTIGNSAESGASNAVTPTAAAVAPVTVVRSPSGPSSRRPVYSAAADGTDRVPLDTLGVIRGLRWSTTINGDWAASWQANLPTRLDHRALQPGRIITIPISPTQAWQGVLKAPQRGTPWQFTADGLAKMLDRWSALAPTSNNALNLNEIVDQAIGRGLAFAGVAVTRPVSLPSLPAGTQQSGSLTLAAALDQVTSQLNEWWNISRSLAVTAATLPTSLTYILQAQDTAGGRVTDGFVTDITVLYQNAATYQLATLQRSNTAARTKFGRFEQTLDLTAQGPLTTAQAQTAGDDYLSANAPRLKFAGSFQVPRGQLLNAGGAPVDPACVVAGGLTRLMLIDPDTNAGELSLGTLQVVMGQTDYDADADMLTLTPLDYSPQGLAALVGSAQSDTGSQASVAFTPQGQVIGEAHLTASGATNITTTALATLTGTVSTNNGTPGAGNLAVTVTVAAGHAYLVTIDVSLFSNVANDVVQATIAMTLGTASGALTAFTPTWTLPTSGRADNRSVSAIFYATGSGTVTFTAQAARFSGTGNINAAAGSSVSVSESGGGH